MPKGAVLEHRLFAESLLFVGLTCQLFYNIGLKQVRDCNPEFQVIAPLQIESADYLSHYY